VRGPLFDGNLEVLDSSEAKVLGGFYAIEADGLTVARMTPSAPEGSGGSGGSGGRSGNDGFLGFNVMVSAANTWDVHVFNSSSLAATDFYTETSHGNLYVSGEDGDAPGLVAISAAKLNTNAPAWAALYSENFCGTLFHTGSVASYSAFNVTAVGAAVADIVVVGESFWVNSTVFNSSGAATLHSQANIFVNGPPYFATDVTDARTPQLVAAGLDALRMVGILDVELNFPWVLG
jgi:hypothetical protein